MRKDLSALESEFIQGGSHDDANSNIAHSTNINSVANITAVIVGDCDSNGSSNPSAMMAKPQSCLNNNNNNKVEQRDEKSLLENDNDYHHHEEEVGEYSLPILKSLSSYSDSHSDTAEEPCSTTAVAVDASKNKNTTQKSVGFSHCSIRSYNQILGDHPLCAVGCPVALGWKVLREETFTVEDYECLREPLRKKKGAKSPTQQGRKQHRRSHNEDESYMSMNMEPSFKYINSQLRLSAQERRERLRDYSDVQIRKEWSRMQKQARRGLIKEGMRQFRMVGMHYAGY